MTVEEVLSTYGAAITSVAAQIGLPSLVNDLNNYTALVAGIITNESSGNANVIGDNGCSYGLMQVNTCAGWLQTYGWNGNKNSLLDPPTNLFYGMSYLNYQLGRYSTVEQAISAYNAGNATSANVGYVNAVIGFINQLGGFVSQAGQFAVANPTISIGIVVVLIAGILGLSYGHGKHS